VERVARAIYFAKHTIMHDHEKLWSKTKQLQGKVWEEIALAAIAALQPTITAAREAGRREEREACALICDGYGREGEWVAKAYEAETADELAARIRARAAALPAMGEGSSSQEGGKHVAGIDQGISMGNSGSCDGGFARRISDERAVTPTASEQSGAAGPSAKGEAARWVTLAERTRKAFEATPEPVQADAGEVLREFEWSGRNYDIHGNRSVPCCPICKGEYPEYKGLSGGGLLGHSTKCRLAAALQPVRADAVALGVKIDQARTNPHWSGTASFGFEEWEMIAAALRHTTSPGADAEDGGWLRCAVSGPDHDESGHMLVTVQDGTYDGARVSVHQDLIRRDLIPEDRADAEIARLTSLVGMARQAVSITEASASVKDAEITALKAEVERVKRIYSFGNMTFDALVKERDGLKHSTTDLAAKLAAAEAAMDEALAYLDQASSYPSMTSCKSGAARLRSVLASIRGGEA
jgi:hypothetical protein